MKKMNILTFDLEEWYTYELFPKGGKEYYLPSINKYLDKLLDLLDEVDTKATFFCLGVIAREYPKVIKKIAERGHEIGCHSDKHILLTKLTPVSFKEDTHVAIDSLQQLIGKKVEFYRAPAFSLTKDTKWAFEVLIEEGISTDCSIFPGAHSFGGFPTFRDGNPTVIEINGNLIREFPISFLTIFNKRFMFSGGGYFRLFPYILTKKLTHQSNYNMAYFHIRDFDKEQKRVYSSRYFFSYYGIDSAFVKFEKYVREFKFVPIGVAINSIDWKSLPKLNL